VRPAGQTLPVSERLDALQTGQPIPYAGDRVARVSAELSTNFRAGDRLVVVQESGDLLHVPADEYRIATAAVDEAVAAFSQLADVDDAAISSFFDGFASRLADDDVFAPIAAANRADIERARSRGRSTTRLVLSDAMRADMIDSLRMWRDLTLARDAPVETVAHTGWSVQARRAPLGVVGFVFEGRPNVFADATGVVRSGNTVVFRIGSDALGTARAISEHALRPALADAGLPAGAVVLVDSPSHAAGWALFSDARLGLAVARGSGPAVAQLGSVARQAGIPVSLHGTGGAWMLVGAAADPVRLQHVVQHSLDRKVCNTANVIVVLDSDQARVMPAILRGADAAAAARGTQMRWHIVSGSESVVPSEWFDTTIVVARAQGDVSEPRADVVGVDTLAVEWEWEGTPEATIVSVPDLATAVELCNRYSPRFTVSIISDDEAERDLVWARTDAPFVGDGFTRWVDGQFALSRPELGLSNWQSGRLLARAGVLSGDSVHTVRLRATQSDHELRR
jgi:glutamate-5-semialdehyde dehydrogenase